MDIQIFTPAKSTHRISHATACTAQGRQASTATRTHHAVTSDQTISLSLTAVSFYFAKLNLRTRGLLFEPRETYGKHRAKATKCVWRQNKC